jgi:S-adenosylmethionine/arginine decarboxylase-like enzyme
MEPLFNHQLVELTAVAAARLSDAEGLSSIAVAAAGAVGMPPLGPPVVRETPAAVAVAMLCRDGHIVLHAVPAEGRCFVAVVARSPADSARGLEVIARRLTREAGQSS